MNVYKIDIEARYNAGVELEYTYDVTAKSHTAALRKADRLLRSERLTVSDKKGNEIPGKFYKLKSYDVVRLARTASLDA